MPVRIPLGIGQFFSHFLYFSLCIFRVGEVTNPFLSICKQGPFGEVEMTALEILERVSAVDRAGCTAPFRPQLDLLENCFDFVRTCLKDGWSEIPEDRPDFKVGTD